MNYYDEIKDKLIKNEVSKKVREYYNNRSDLETYYEVGKLLSEAGSHYGDNIIREYSIKLQREIGKRYNVRYLFDMKRLYLFLKVHPVGAQLTMSHYRILFSLKNDNEINYYIRECINHNYSKRELQERIKNKEYYRLSNETRDKLKNDKELEINNFVKDPIILNKKRNYDKISEFALKEIILNDLDNFLLQLGNGFSYIGNEYKIKIGNVYNYIDILLFNIVYNCYVVVELKINKLTKQDIGQIMVYMNYVNEFIKTTNQNNTIGIIVCKEKDKYLIKYSTDKRILATTYELV